MKERLSMRVVVDRAACEANGVCAGLLPQIFNIGDNDELHIRVAEIPAGLADVVRDTVEACPRAALRLEGSFASSA
jgi:ferredoxin